MGWPALRYRSLGSTGLRASGFGGRPVVGSLRRKRGERELNIVLFVLMRFRFPVLPLWRVQTSTTGALVCRGSATLEPMSGCGSTRGFGKETLTQAKGAALIPRRQRVGSR